MSILRRVKDISVATLNEMLESSEDPVRLIDRYLQSQREQIEQSERLYRECLNHAQSLRQQVLQSEQMKEKREQQALIALKAGEEDIAKLALQEKMLHEEKAEQYRTLYEESKHSILDLEEQLNQLKADYQEVAAKRGYYQARIETVRLQQQMNARMAGMQGSQTPRMFARLEDKVSDMELEARTLREVRRAGQEAVFTAGSAIQSVLETELEKLKKKLDQEGWRKP
ncbi:PspA/IM30 family protein [Gorillibacterium sp. sgz5001074]|uniref:PspA/IM30 family protein n=1 Tax=Gorillibacterium sp. sgz5001074 TaxID=3446695 RepID=UPI003F670D32